MTTSNAAPPPRRYDIRIARDGTWFHEGSPIRRPELVRLFARVLRREPDGSYWLVTPHERGPIAVEDVPFVAVELAVDQGEDGPQLRLRTNLDAWIPVDADHPLVMREDGATRDRVPYVIGDGGLAARISRAVYYQLVERAVPEDRAGASGPGGAGRRFGVYSAGCFFPLGDLHPGETV